MNKTLEPSKGFKWAIFDIDGVLANNLHRVSLMHQKRYDEYYGPVVLNDKPIIDYIETLEEYSRQGYFISLWTARNEVCRHYTLEWLRKINIPFNELRMRPSSDHRKASIIKSEWLSEELSLGNKPNIAFDDDPANVENYQSHDIRTIHVKVLGEYPYKEEIKHASAVHSSTTAGEYSKSSQEQPQPA